MADLLRVLIVDDEPPARQALARLLRDMPRIEIIAAVSNGMEALEVLSGSSIQLVFLDIEMPVLTGMELAERLRLMTTTAAIFVTAYPQYAVTAFEVEPADYLLKPVDPARLASAIVRARGRLAQLELQTSLNTLLARKSESEKSWIWVEYNNTQLRLLLEDVEWFSADGDYVQAHTAERGFLMRGSLNGLEGTLPPSRFLRVHRSTIVNVGAVTCVSSSNGNLSLTTNSGASLKVGRRARSCVRRQLAAFRFRSEACC